MTTGNGEEVHTQPDASQREAALQVMEKHAEGVVFPILEKLYDKDSKLHEEFGSMLAMLENLAGDIIISVSIQESLLPGLKVLRLVKEAAAEFGFQEEDIQAVIDLVTQAAGMRVVSGAEKDAPAKNISTSSSIIYR